MATTTPLQSIVSGFDLTTTYQDIYEVPTTKAGIGIDAVTLNNYSASNATFSIRLVPSGAGGVLNEIITEEAIRSKGNSLAPALIGHSLIKGGKIQAKASANNSISVVDITATIIDL